VQGDSFEESSGLSEASEKRFESVAYPREVYFEFFHKQIAKHTNGSLELVWSKEAGFHTVARRDIHANEYFMWLPAKYVLSVCKHIKSLYTSLIIQGPTLSTSQCSSRL
jgi:hypothetical protein